MEMKFPFFSFFFLFFSDIHSEVSKHSSGACIFSESLAPSRFRQGTAPQFTISQWGLTAGSKFPIFFSAPCKQIMAGFSFPDSHGF